jgi:predicted glycosyl hydrolase (DUF1957 family)
MLADAGLRYFLVDGHGILYARPRPRFGTYAPIFTETGVAAFGRDHESSQQVWSSQVGYPGDPEYREFGLGVCLYVKFMKHLAGFLFFASILSILSITIY